MQAAEITAAIRMLDSREPHEVVRALNILGRKSFELADGSYATKALGGFFYLENFPELVLAIGSLLDVLNPIGEVLFRFHHEEAARVVSEWTDPNAVLHIDDIDGTDDDQWRLAPPGQQQLFEIIALSRNLDDNQMLLSLLNLIRNLSFDMANEYLLATSAPILRHLVSLQYAALYSTSAFQTARLAVEALVNIGHRIDITSQRRQQFHCFADDSCSASALARDFFKLRLCGHFSEVSTVEYVGAATALMSAVLIFISETPWRDRYMILQMLQLLVKLAQNPDNALYISKSPQQLLESLVLLLCANKTAADPLFRQQLVTQTQQQQTINLAPRPYGRGSLIEVDTQSADVVPTMLASTSEAFPIPAEDVSETATAPTNKRKRLEFVPPVAPFFRDSSDEEVRDAALEALLAIAQLPSSSTSSTAASTAAAALFTRHVVAMLGTKVIDNPMLSMRARIINTPHCIDILFRIAQSSNSIYGISASSASYPIAGAVDPSGSLIFNSIATNEGNSSHAASTAGAGSSSSSSVDSGMKPAPSLGVGWGGGRSNGSDKALQLLELLLTSASAERKVRSIREDLIIACFSDDFIADAVCNKIQRIHQLAPVSKVGGSLDAEGADSSGVAAASLKGLDVSGQHEDSGLILKLSNR